MSNEYPRPDWVRPNLTWKSLNGPWSFIFDDNDVGLAREWHLTGLPAEVSVDPSLTNTSGSSALDSESITAKIVGDAGTLLEGNIPTASTAGVTHAKREITVPFVWQSAASGIAEKGVHEVFWYERNITDLRSASQKENGDRVLLRFCAVDYEASVWVDGHFFGAHRGGHVPFELDVTDAFASDKKGGEETRVTMRVFDSAFDLTQPRGKQYWGAKPESIFYTPSSGIWGDVWMEVVPSVRLGDSSKGTVLRSDDIAGGKLAATLKVIGRPAGSGYTVAMEVQLHGEKVSTTERIAFPRDSDLVSFAVDMRLPSTLVTSLRSSPASANHLSKDSAWLNGIALWAPSHPILYTLTLTLYDPTGNIIDTVTTPTGMRSLSWHNSTLHLNGHPYFQALLLDQSYWPSTHMTPPTPSALITDIHLAKAMGFNGVRKHQTISSPAFLYAADTLGFLVWGEMANAYSFSPAYVERFDAEWREAVLLQINHPCVVAWTPVNESWGYTDLAHSIEQRNHIRSLYYATKVLDPSRPVNDNCGWEHVRGDLTTFHDYADGEALAATCKSLDGILASKAGRPLFVKPIPGVDEGAAHTPGAPIICTEFGGINIARQTQIQTSPSTTPEKGDDRDWGYTTASDPKDLLSRIGKMMKAIVEPGLVCGFVYTQLTDIEQEVNGLYTPEREAKLEPERVREIIEGVVERWNGLQKKK
ncbi:glycoside hydrolase family 2 protein [Bimuria novae-zelandiae CBS 107.79]|uniref:Glycoside hydrolase family 2 protein n=1 Tax=Bimuria novae-zelandiae CBS 107.79 TaxID=1447943 RepID=A0A6A5UJ04_9PLEO|nr:glycoside hydrolase family 2 protein [Bimuria novae-zelandiae CBS 107.79]